jgi:hypothetical protein
MYGLTWLRDGVIYFNRLTRAGQRAYSDVEVVSIPDGGSAFSNDAPNLAWGGDSFGLIYTTYGVLSPVMQRLDGHGTRLGNAIDLGLMAQFLPTIVRVPNGNWAVFGSCCGSRSISLYGRTISSDGTLSANNYNLGPANSSYGIALSGDNLGAIKWDRSTPDTTNWVSTIAWTRRTSSLDLLNDSSLARQTTPGSVDSPAIAGTAAGYALTWAETTPDGTKKTPFIEVDHNGTRTCGPIDLRALSSLVSQNPEFHPMAMAAGDMGYAVLGVNGTDPPTIEVIVLRPGCQFVERFVLAYGFSALLRASLIAAGKAGFAVTYELGSSLPGSAYVGTFGPHFCD